MNKGLIAYSAVPIVLFLSFYFSLNTSQNIDYSQYSIDQEFYHDVQDDLFVNADDLGVNKGLDCYASPHIGKSFVGFKEAIAFKESRGNYFSVNTLGYLGKYQFGETTLELIGIYNASLFLNDPGLQEKAFIANAMRNKWVLRRDIKRFVGKRIDGVAVTESGILAAAHLAGPGSVKTYLRSYGAIGFTDAYGTSVRNYMKKFSGYDTSFIEANKKAKVSLL